MHFRTGLVAFAASAQLVAASPVPKVGPPKPGMRLIKTSEDEPAFWISEQDQFEQYTAKNIGFFDVTDVTVRRANAKVWQRKRLTKLLVRTRDFSKPWKHDTKISRFAVKLCIPRWPSTRSKRRRWSVVLAHRARGAG
jgi:hypothetical protein